MSNYATLVDLLIKNEMKGIKNHERILELGSTPKILQDKSGFADLTLAIKASTISKICFDHGIPTSMLKRLPDILDNPKSLFLPADTSKVDSIVVVTFEVKGHEPVIIPIKKNTESGRKRFNMVTSMYGKSGPNPESKWKKDNLLIWEHPTP